MSTFILLIVALVVIIAGIIWLVYRAYQMNNVESPEEIITSRHYGFAALALVPLAIIAALSVKWAHDRRQALRKTECDG